MFPPKKAPLPGDEYGTPDLSQGGYTGYGTKFSELDPEPGCPIYLTGKDRVDLSAGSIAKLASQVSKVLVIADEAEGVSDDLKESLRTADRVILMGSPDTVDLDPAFDLRAKLIK